MIINETITTKLHYKDIALIAVAMCEYQRLYKDTANPEILQRMNHLVDRLGVELYNCWKRKSLRNIFLYISYNFS